MMKQKADIVCDSVGSTLTVHIRGEIDHHTAADIRGRIDDMLFQRRPRRLVLNLSSVTFMDSSGLGLIMGRFSVMKELGGEMAVCDPSPETRSILTLAGMERLVRVEYSDGHIPPQPPVTQKGRSGGQAPRAPYNGATGNPAPGNPAPGNPAPGNPAPGNPAPGNPAPGNPAPGNPAPGIRKPGRVGSGRKPTIRPLKKTEPPA